MASEKKIKYKTEKQKNKSLLHIICFSFLCLYCVYIAGYIYKTSFDIEGERYFCLTDDMMISMTYAKNFANGHGLVWNAGGERVEGYTNLAWTLYMSLFHIISIPLSKMSLFIQISGALFLILSLYFVRKIAISIYNSPITVYGAVILTMLYSPLIFWCLTGTEVSVLTFLVCVIVWKTIQYMKGKCGVLNIYLLLGLGTLIRIDMAVPLFGIWIFFLISDSVRRKEHIWYGVVITMLFIGGQTLFRLVYYGDILPNTYYLKMTGYPVLLRIAKGIYAFVQFILGMKIVLFFVPFLVLHKKIKSNKFIVFLLYIIILQLIYSIYVGGDAWEEHGGSNRFISIIMPLFFILFSNVIIQLTKNIRMLIPIIVISILLFNIPTLGEMFLIKNIFQVDMNKDFVIYAKVVKAITKPDAKIAVTSAGIIPYFSERKGVDELGKCDKKIAHSKSIANYDYTSIISHKPGHMKYDHDYIFKKYKPDVVSNLPGAERDKGMKYLRESYLRMEANNGHKMYNLILLKDSKNILWKYIQLNTEKIE